MNVIAFSLEFPSDTYPVREYQEVGIRDKDGQLKKPADRTVQLPDRIFEFIKSHSAIQAARYDMIGHSAGGQFIHRFLLFHDSPYVDRAVVGAPGWFTFPDPSQPYPYGLKDTDRASDEVIARFLGTELPWPRVELTMATTLAVAVSVWLCWTIYSVDDRRVQVREGEKSGSSRRVRPELRGSQALLALPHLLDRIDCSLVLSSLVAALVCCAVAFTVVMGL